MQSKSFYADIVEKSDIGGRILITTNGIDRDRDRVMPHGAILENYLNNPVVMWGHSYEKPSDIVGRTTNLEVTDTGIIADFELRPPANDQDPQNIVRLLWDGGWIRTASIGFRPIEAIPNEFGGKDFTAWELLEYSLTPVPANAAALRLAAKALDALGAPEADAAPVGQEKDVAPVVEAPAEESGKGNDSQPDAPAEGDTGNADAIEAVAQELRLAAILQEFVAAIRPYLQVEGV